MAKLTLLLVDDHAVVRSGFKVLLQTWDDVDVVAEANSGEEALPLYTLHRPEVVVMDIAMAGMGGIEAIKRLMALDPQVRILALSAHEDSSYAKRALQAGALGYLSKRTAPEVLIDALRMVAHHQRFIDPIIAQRMANQRTDSDTHDIDKLSPREFEVFLLLAKGRSVLDISQALGLSASTVGTHLYKVKLKLQLSNQSEMTLLAMRHGLLDEASP
ncbi:MAG: DNA-binding response regulator [Betaproteobacteria bacterium]|nr:DNA-binding response regulator [Betaproteobacteria bacterium]NBY33333.1 DNA-binding response regulator [Betaproteobacteria bacterium]